MDILEACGKSAKVEKLRLTFLVVLLVSNLLSSENSAAQSSVCVEDGGTAECVGPEVSEYTYYVGSTGVAGSTGPISAEAPGIASVQSGVLAQYDECSSSFQYLPPS